MYKINIIRESEIINKIEKLPPIPFIVENSNSGNLYQVSEINGWKDRFLLTDINLGVSFDRNYTTSLILELINNGDWILRKSKIIIG